MGDLKAPHSFSAQGCPTSTAAVDLSPRNGTESTNSTPEPSDGKLYGRVEPRIFTPPLRELTPETSDGFEIIAFAESLGMELMPWQRWFLTHSLELNPDGSYRFKEILLEVSRQNGKTTVVDVLIAYWLNDGLKILSTSATTTVAEDSWEAVIEIVEDNPEVFGPPKVDRQNGKKSITLLESRGKYKIAGATRRGGRGARGCHRVIEDELREHLDWQSHAAAANTILARPDGQVWMLSNAGDDRSEVLNHYHAQGVAQTNPTLGFFSWSAPDGCEITDRSAWAQANPALGHTITEKALETALSQPASIFRTENLCQFVPSLDEVVSASAWSRCLDPGTLQAHKARVALCLDVSSDMKHATLVAAAVLPDGRVRIETVRAWESTAQVRKDLPALLKKIKPRVFGWFPGGPSAAIAVDLKGISQAKEIPSQAPQRPVWASPSTSRQQESVRTATSCSQHTFSRPRSTTPATVGASLVRTADSATPPTQPQEPST